MNAKTIFEQHFNRSPSVLASAPGRVNLLGEHVDYNDGIVLPVAIDRSVQFAAAPTDDGILHLHAVNLNEHTAVHLEKLIDKLDINGGPLPKWAYYPAGVAWALKKNGFEVSGTMVSYSSNIPIGSGLSSSAAVEVGSSFVFREFNPWDAKPFELAQICLTAESDYVGVSCGLMDQFASACGVSGEVLYLDTRTLHWGSVPLPAETAIVIADSGVRRELTSSAYNDRRTSCEQAVEILQKYLPDITALRDVSTTEFAAYSHFLPDTIRKRAEHVVKEIDRVDSAIRALRNDNQRAFGALMYAGHRSLRDLYQVSIPELDLLVELSRNIPGCIGARLTGAGFGGCTVNLVEEEHTQTFIERLITGYQQETGQDIQVYPSSASSGAKLLHN